MSFLNLFWPEGGGAIALVGAGGKTSILHQASLEAAEKGIPLLMTVSTKLQRPTPIAADRICPDGDSRPPIPMSVENVLWVGYPVAEGRKWKGPEMSRIEEVIASHTNLRILIEADGAAGCSLKVPGDMEPVIPAGVSGVAVVIGLSALNKPINASVVHRLERFLEITDASPGDPLTTEHIVEVLVHPKGSFKGVSPKVRRIIILNQADTHPKGFKTSPIIQGLRDRGIRGAAVVLSSLRTSPCIWSIINI